MRDISKVIGILMYNPQYEQLHDILDDDPAQTQRQWTEALNVS